jgi:FkbM family methyltransferase
MSAVMKRLGALASGILAAIPADVLSGKAPAALYGMGFLGRWAVDALPEAGIRLAACYDGNPALAGETIGGIPVRSPDDLAGDRPGCTFVTARHAVKPVSERLAALGLRCVSADAFFVARDFSSFRALHDRVDDDRSRAVLAAVLETMLTGDRTHLLPVFEKDQYFALPQFCGIEREIYVDAGAYVGDSLERFVWTHYGVFEKAIAFEPGPRQFLALGNRTGRLLTEWALDAGQIELVPAALGARSGIEHAATQSGQMTSLAVGSGDEKIRIVRLDDHLAGSRVSFLKADVEGMEMPLLEGAAETIRRYRPKLAICVYHSPQLMETVLYAWVA